MTGTGLGSSFLLAGTGSKASGLGTCVREQSHDLFLETIRFMAAGCMVVDVIKVSPDCGRSG